MASSGAQLLCTDSLEPLSRRFHLSDSDSGFFLNILRSSWSVSIIPEKQRVFFGRSGVLLFTPDSSALADQISQTLHINRENFQPGIDHLHCSKHCYLEVSERTAN